MIGPELISNTHEHISLLAPDIERDAPLSVEWMSGDDGRETQALMGVADKDIHEHTLEEAETRILSFIESKHEVVWMIELYGEVSGVLEVHLIGSKYLPAPSIHVMIGDVSARGKGAGKTAMEMAIAWLQYEKGIEIVFSRFRTNNRVSEQLLLGLGFEYEDQEYTDDNGLKWQNVIRRSED